MSKIIFGADAIDGYLLDGAPPKPRVVEAILAARSGDPRAQPFYRAFEAVGARAADEALIALRIVLAGAATDDALVARLRDLVKAVRGGGPGAEAARAAYASAVGATSRPGSGSI